MTTATKVADGQATAATQYNAVIDEIETHAHGSEYGDVQHSYLSDGAIDYLNHEALDKHLGDTADVVGGDEAVHGLQDSCYPVGSLTSGLIIDQGTAITDAKSGSNQTITINFNLEFASAPKVFISPTGEESGKVAVQSVTVRTCIVRLGFFTDGRVDQQVAEAFSWVAVGVRG